MHCDIVVAANPGGDGRLYLVGGNVLQGVTMRVLPLNRGGAIWGLPQRARVPRCVASPASEAACSFNRQDWVALAEARTVASAPWNAAAARRPAAVLHAMSIADAGRTCSRCPVLQRPVDALPAPADR